MLLQRDHISPHVGYEMTAEVPAVDCIHVFEVEDVDNEGVPHLRCVLCREQRASTIAEATLVALERDAVRWDWIARARESVPPMNLCKLYAWGADVGHECEGCPVMRNKRVSHCYDTPAHTYAYSWRLPDAAAQAAYLRRLAVIERAMPVLQAPAEVA